MKQMLFFSIALLFFISCKENKESEWKIADGIYLLDKETSVKSLNELVILLKGKQIYIDRWATWCSPCLEEFKYKDLLHEFLANKGISMVYLNSDKEIKENDFYEFIIAHNLRGYHLRLNDELKADLIKQNIFIPIIPQYMIIGKDGKVIDNKALRPSDGEKLFSQLDSMLLLK
jgi:thiol-disulfide isomerase/thioredoxin